MKAKLIGSGKCGLCVCLGHLEATGKIFPFHTSQYKPRGWHDPATSPDPSTSVLTQLML